MKKHLDRNPLPPLPNSCYIDKTDLFFWVQPPSHHHHTHPPTQASHWLFQFGHWKGAHHYLPMVFILIPCSVLPIMLLEPFPCVGVRRAGASSCQYILRGKHTKKKLRVKLELRKNWNPNSEYSNPKYLKPEFRSKISGSNLQNPNLF
jgi:hypothetical protein